MKFTIDSNSLSKPLQTVAGVVEKRQTLPILTNVLLETNENRLSITGTDLEVELEASVDLDSPPLNFWAYYRSWAKVYGYLPQPT